MPLVLVEIKDFNASIDNKPFFDLSVKKQTRNERKTCRNAKKQLLYYRKLIRLFLSSKRLKTQTNLWRQTNIIIFHEINFMGKLEEDNDTTMFLLLETRKKLFWVFL